MRQLLKTFWLERPQKHYADQAATLAAAMGCVVMVLCGPHRQLGFGGAPRCSWWQMCWGIFAVGWAIAAPRWPCGCCITCTCFWRALKKKRCLPPPTVGPAAHQLVLRDLGLQRLPGRCGVLKGCRSSYIGVAAAVMALIALVIMQCLPRPLRW